MNILNRISQLRDERGWTNYKLAKEAHIPEGSLNNLFRLNNLPPIPTLESICKGFNITLSQFFAEGNEPVVLNEEQQKIPEGFSTHKLRHIVATLMYKYGRVDIRSLQQILSYESIATTEFYTHVDDSQLQAAANANPLAMMFS